MRSIEGQGLGLSRRFLVLLIVLAAGTLVLSPEPAKAVGVPQGLVVTENPANYTPQVLGGDVLSITEVGNRVIVGGEFTQVKEAGDPTILSRVNIFAFDKTTGAIDQSFVPVVDGPVYVVASAQDGSKVFLGGRFANVNGQPSFGLAKLDVATGNADPVFSATTAGKVRDLVVRNGKVYLGGDIWSVNGVPRSRLAVVDATTGAVDSFNVPVSEPRRTSDWVAKLDVSPDGSKLMIIGNFLKVGGLDRVQIAMIDLTTTPASVANWSTDGFTPACSSSFWTYMRDVEFSLDGSYFVVVTTGGPHLGTLCDAAVRFESDATGTNLKETWADLTGGDTLYSVMITDVAIYVGGHQRWFNNHTGRDFAGPGAVSRDGIAALDPINGVPLSWNPGKERGVGTFDIYATADGIYIGSDTEWVGGEYHPRLAMFPLSGGTTVPQPTPITLPGQLYVAQLDDTLTQRLFDGTAFGVASPAPSTPVAWSTVGGAFYESGMVYYTLPDGSLYARPFDGEAFGSAVDQNTWVSWTSATGMSWDEGRLYYTLAGDPALYYQYFSLESGIVGSQTFVVSGDGDGLDWSSVVGLSVANGQLYYASADGNLRRIGLLDGDPIPGSEEVVSGPLTGDGLDWDMAGMFFGPSIDAPPTVSITAPVDGSTVSGVVAVTADATDDVGVAQVEFFAGGVSIGVDIDGTDGWSTTWDTTAETDGPVTVTATATDTITQTGSDTVAVTVDNMPPTVSITAPVDGSTVSGVVAVTADATDDVGVAQVEFFAGGVSIGVDIDGTDGWSTTWDTTAETDGPVTVTATATDTNTQTASDTVAVTVDNAAPGVVVMVVSNPGSLGSGELAARDRLVGSGFVVNLVDDDTVTAGDASGASFVLVSYSVNAGTVSTTFLDVSNPVWVAKPWLLDDMKMTGPVGNTDFGTVRASTIAILDATHPMAAGRSGDVTFTTTTKTFSWGLPPASASVVATAGGLPTMFAIDAGGLLSDGTTAAGCRLSFPVYQSGPTAFTADAWAMFDATATWAKNSCGAIDAFPVVSITAPVDGSTVSGVVTVTADATDDVGVTQVEFFANTVSLGIDADGTDGWSTTWDTTLETDGPATVTATATDTSTQTSTDTVTVTVDNVPPVDLPPTVSITAPVDGSTVSGVVTLTADATDDVGVTQVEFFADAVSLGIDADGTDGWSATWDTTAETDGPVTVTATATDTNTQTASDAVAVTVDNAAPGVVVMVVSNPGSLGSGELAARDRLVGSGFVVNLVDDDTVTPGDASGASFVLVSYTANAGKVGTTFLDVSNPVWVAKPWLLDDMKMTGAAPNTDFGTVRASTVTILDAAHPMAAGRSGDVTFTTTTKTFSWGLPPAGASIIATAGGQPTMFAIDAGGLLSDGTTAAGCRLSFPVYQSSPTAFTADAWAMFDATATWAKNNCP